MTVISACFVTLLTIWSFASEVTEESVLIIKDFGIQLRILYRSGSEETKVCLELSNHKFRNDFYCNTDTNYFHAVFGQRQNFGRYCSWIDCWLLRSVQTSFPNARWSKAVTYVHPSVSGTTRSSKSLQGLCWYVKQITFKRKKMKASEYVCWHVKQIAQKKWEIHWIGETFFRRTSCTPLRSAPES